jgi:hypothetical protein
MRNGAELNAASTFTFIGGLATVGEGKAVESNSSKRKLRRHEMDIFTSLASYIPNDVDEMLDLACSEGCSAFTMRTSKVVKVAT